MQPFAPGDRVVAINTNISVPLFLDGEFSQQPFWFPDGPLRQDVIYHVAETVMGTSGLQGIFLTGIRVMWGPKEIPWDFTRFRKVDTLKGHLPKKRRRKQPVAAACRATCSVA
jgi:hypothetical protein